MSAFRFEFLRWYREGDAVAVGSAFDLADAAFLVVLVPDETPAVAFADLFDPDLVAALIEGVREVRGFQGTELRLAALLCGKACLSVGVASLR